jgi:tetratricopeptide (TPR) repeat protein
MRTTVETIAMQEKPLKKECSGGRESTWVVFLLLGVLIFTIYANTFHAAWQFDDKPNIVKESRLHIEDLRPATLWNTFFAFKANGQLELFRPLPRLSFALNWYWGQDSTFGYHLVNTAIHIITSLFLYLVTYNLLLTPNLKRRYGLKDAVSIALLSTVFWAINPVQTQAITYIVQRMASMAAMFYVMGIYCFLKARGEHEHNQHKAMLFYLGCLASFLGAIMSKENAAMLPISLCLIEVIFFRDIKGLIRNKNISYVSAVIVGSIVLLSIVFIVADGFGMFSKGYALRSFTMQERLLTQSRIIVLYLSQLVYPLPGRLSITHDITISTSLLSPWTTLPSILAVLLLIGLGLSQVVKRPLVALAILFFFLNHVIESTILPLELMFEHRNYLPSFFLFLPFAALMIYMINYYRDRKQSMVVMMTTFVTLLIMGVGCFTYLRNRDWRTETSLWRQAMEKAPLDARPAWNIANAIAWDKNVSPLQLDVGLALFEKALSLNNAIEENKSRILRNIGLIHLRRGAYEQAVTAFKQSLRIDPYFREVRINLVSAYMMMGKWDAATEQLDAILSQAEEGVTPDYYKMKGYILLWKHQHENAMKFLRKALAIEPENADVLLNTGVALSLSGDHVNADLFLQKAGKISSNKIRFHYALIENSVRAGEMEKAGMYARQMLAAFSVKTVFDGFDTFRDDFRTAPIALEFIVPVVQKEMGQMLEDMEILARADA